MMLIFVGVFVFIANFVCFFSVPWRWMRMVIMLLVCMGGLAFLCMAAFGMAMGAGHGSHHGPDPQIFGDVVFRGGCIISIISLVLAWIGYPANPPKASVPVPVPVSPMPMQSLRTAGKQLPGKNSNKIR